MSILILIATLVSLEVLIVSIICDPTPRTPKS